MSNDFELTKDQKLELIKNAIRSVTVQIYNTEIEMIANDTKNLEVMESLVTKLNHLRGGKNRLLDEIKKVQSEKEG